MKRAFTSPAAFEEAGGQCLAGRRILTCGAVSKGRTGLPQQSFGRRTPSDWQSAGGPASIGLRTRQSDGIPALGRQIGSWNPACSTSRRAGRARGRIVDRIQAVAPPWEMRLPRVTSRFAGKLRERVLKTAALEAKTREATLTRPERPRSAKRLPNQTEAQPHVEPEQKVRELGQQLSHHNVSRKGTPRRTEPGKGEEDGKGDSRVVSARGKETPFE